MSVDLMMQGFETGVIAARPEALTVDSLRMVGGLRGGIDPGKTGWVVVERDDGSLRGWQIPVVEEKVPGKTKAGNPKTRTRYDRAGIIRILHEIKAMGVIHITLEAQQATHLRGSQAGAANNAVRASFMTGYGFALWELGLDMVGIEFDTAWPSAWKKKMGISPPSEMKDQKKRETEVKRLAKERAQELHPDHDFRRTPRCDPSPDQCEAALLIHYGRVKGWN